MSNRHTRVKRLVLWGTIVTRTCWRGGERLSLVELAPPPVSNADNFFADPLWAELADLVEVPSEFGTRQTPRIEKGRRELDGMDRPLTAQERESLVEAFPEFKEGDPNRSLSDLAREARRKGENLEPEQRQRAAQSILALLAFANPVLARIEDLSARSAGRFPIRYEDGFQASLEHLTCLLRIASLLHLRAGAKLELAETEAAERDAKTIFSIAERLSTEPLLISLLVRAAIEGLALDVIDRGIKKHAWNEAALGNFELVLARTDIPSHLTLALRGERGGFNQFVESAKGNQADVIFQNVLRTEPPSAGEKFVQDVATAVYMKVFANTDRASYNRLQQRWIEASSAASQSGLNPSAFTGEFETEKSSWWGLDRQLTRITAPTMTSSGERAAFVQSKIALTRIACALERYRLRNGSYPESLDALSGSFEGSAPRDAVTLELIRYRRAAPDEFTAWVVGWNMTDEGGRVGAKNSEGDWVWGQSSKP